MAPKATHQHFSELMDSMFKGLLDEQFQVVENANNPGLVIEMVTLTLFRNDSQGILTNLEQLMDQSVFDYMKMDAYVHQLKGSSSSVGVQNVKRTCIQLRQVFEENDKEGW